MQGTFYLRRKKLRAKKILVCRTDRIGDFVSSLPVFEVLRNQLDMEVHVLCNPLVLPLVEHNLHISVAHAYHPEIEKYIVEHLLSLNFDACLVLVNDPVARRLLPQLKAIPIRVGPISKPSSLLVYNYPVLQKRSRSVRNEAEYNLNLLRPFGYKGEAQPKPQLYFSEQETVRFSFRFTYLAASLNPKEGYVAMHVGMSGSALNWPFERYLALLRWFVDQQIQVVLTGIGQVDEGLVQALLGNLTESQSSLTANFVDQLSIRELALLYAGARLYVGPSTGPTHIAGAVGTPIVTFYSPIRVQSATRWTPFKADMSVFTPPVECPAIYHCKGEACKEYECMSKIDLSAVQQACLAKMRTVVG